MGKTLRFACACKKLQGELRDVGPDDTHILCHCNDCRAAYVHLGKGDPGKVGILQTAQSKIHFTQGGEHLSVFRNSPKGPLRWYATCCDTPLFHTMPRPRMVHAGVLADLIEDDLGPIEAEGHLPPGEGGGHRNALRMVRKLGTRMAVGNLKGSWRDTPLFDDDGSPVTPPQLLTREQRAAALMGVGG